MEKTIRVEKKRCALSLAADITYAQVEHWYGASRKDLKISVIYPKHVTEAEPRPLILWICGGGFRTMDRNVWLPQMMYLAEKGYVIASPDYRTTNEARFPQPLEDIKAAIRYMKAHADCFAVDAHRVFVMGESAGGALAALAAVTGECREYEVGDYLAYTSRVQAGVDFYGVTDCEHGAPRKATGSLDDGSRERFVGPDPQNAARASAVNYVNEQTPPILILHGTNDALVNLDEQSRKFYHKLQENNVKSDLIIIEGGEHGDDIFYQNEVMDRIDEFLKSV